MNVNSGDGPDPGTAARRAWREGAGVAFATSAYGISFGALAVASGLDVWQTCVLSLLMFSGGSQFAFVGVIGGGGIAAAGAAIVSAGLLGVRNVAYGIRMAPIVGTTLWRRIAAVQVTIDESTAVGLAQPTPRSRVVGFWVTGIGIYLGWNLSTLLGALLGDVLGDPRAWGLDAAAAAAFLALLWPRLRARQPIAVGIAAAVIAAGLTPVMAPGLPVIVAALVAVVVGWSNLLGSHTHDAHSRDTDSEVPPARSLEPWEEPGDTPEREGLP